MFEYVCVFVWGEGDFIVNSSILFFMVDNYYFKTDFFLCVHNLININNVRFVSIQSALNANISYAKNTEMEVTVLILLLH